jgi:hypothetical protein
MCSQPPWPLKIADEVFHCQLGFADHGAPGALNQPFVALFDACDGSRPRVVGGSGTQVSKAFARVST